MIKKEANNIQASLFFSMSDMLNQKHALYILANKIDWSIFDKAFTPLYCKDNGRPAKPIRLMVGLLILKHLRNISDESIVEQWSENIYYQYFCGEKEFKPTQPCASSELVHFRNRIGEKGVELILKESIRINGPDSEDTVASIDSTVQEKNITFPTDNKLHRKIIKRCKEISQKEGFEMRQTYTFTLKYLAVDQRFRNHPKNKKKARKADKKVKIIAGRLVRELERQLPKNSIYQNELELFKQIINQKKSDNKKIYSIHEPDTQCIAKGKENKKYEFGNKVSIVYTQNTGVIIGATSFRNEYDGHTIEPALEQIQDRFGIKSLLSLFADRGYKGVNNVRGVEVYVPKPYKISKFSKYQQKKLKTRHKKRAAIEPIIGHLKSDHRLNRNFYKGIIGDSINVLLSAAAFNFKRMMRKWKSSFLSSLFYFIETVKFIFYATFSDKKKYVLLKMTF